MEDDLYVVLGIGGGDAKVSQLEVRKAYRTQALIWHPDKQVGKKPVDVAAAAVEFDKIQRAFEVLGDEKARKAYDELRELRKSRLEKEKQLSSKRQKMMQDLRDRERAFESGRADQREEELSAKRLQAEIARIRAANKRRTAGQGFDFSGLAQAPKESRREKSPKTKRTPASAPAPAPAPAQAAEMQSTLKVTWTSTDGGYTASRLKEIFEEFGGVEDVVIRESKSRKKGSAVVVMSSKEAAIAATNVPCGDFSNPLLVVPVLPFTSARTEPEISYEAGPHSVVGAGYRSFENDVLTKMRQAGERARIIKEMQEEDSKG